MDELAQADPVAQPGIVPSPARSNGSADKVVQEAYSTQFGTMFLGRAEHALASDALKRHRGKVQLIFTSPPFPLNRKKKYGNLKGEAYLEWIGSMAPLFKKYLRPKGSIVIELGNAWEPGKPVMSVLGLKALLEFLERGKLHLCQQFVCYNPARLPTPIQWVNKERIRVKDSFTHVWWMGKDERPRASNKRVLKEYSPAMQYLLRSKKYNPGRRPSEHTIGQTSFLRNNGGAIPPNVLTFANTRTNDEYQEYCRQHGLQPHPARMPAGLVEFFVRFLTNRNDLVLDPFAGSNTTGAVAERLARRWIAIEPRADYIEASKGRFSLKGGFA